MVNNIFHDKLLLESLVAQGSIGRIIQATIPAFKDMDQIMYKFKIVKLLSEIEFFFGIYRNYTLLGDGWRKIVIIRIFLQSCITVATSLYFVFSNFKGLLVELDNVTYFFLSTYVGCIAMNHFVAIILSSVNSSNFKEFIFDINAVHELYKDDEMYKQLTKKQQRKFNLDLALVVITMSITTIMYIYDETVIVSTIMSVLMLIVDIYQEYGLLYEIFVFYNYIEIINVFLKFLNKSVSIEVGKLNNEGDEIVNDGNLSRILEDIKKWNEATMLLGSASDNLSQCFGAQVKLFDRVILLYT